MDGHVKDLWHKGRGKARERTPRYGKGKRWQVRWIDINGERRTRVFDNHDEASSFLARANIEIANGTFIDPKRARNVTVAELAKLWLETKIHLKPKTVENYEMSARKISALWGHRSLASLKHSEIASWVADMRSSGASYSTVHHAYVNFKGMLDLAVKDGVLPSNPAEGISVGAVHYKTKMFLTHSQVEQLAQECHGFETVIRVLAITGLRFGEMAALRVSDFDEVNRRLIISRSATEVRGKMSIGVTKTNRVRAVPLPRFLTTEIAESLKSRELKADDILFPDSGGGMIRNRNWVKRVFIPALDRLGPDFPKISPHSLRHTAASMAIAAGADIKVLQLMLGHAKSSMTLDQYGHLYPDRLDEIASALELARSESLR